MSASLKNILEKAYRKLLQLIFGLDKWHISPLDERPYAIDIISYCNSLENRERFAEIGCGLGDITRNVLYAIRTGYDLDGKVLKAARYLPVKGEHKNIEYREFQFPVTPLKEKTNVLTLVNWIHHIEPSLLKNKIAEYFEQNLLPNGQIIIDTVQDPQYMYNHNIAQLTNGLNCLISRIGSYARNREVWAIKKTT